MKDIPGEGPLRIEIRGEFLNAFNPVNFRPPKYARIFRQLSRIFTAQPGRVIQLAAKIIW